jgi:DNA-binding MarR family transcriptional regulator
MESVSNSNGSNDPASGVREAMHGLVTQLSLLNQQVGARLELRLSDLYCLDLIHTHGPLSPTALARMAGMHPATMTGVLDRLERGRWIARERDPADRRGVTLHALCERRADIVRLYSGMNDAVDRICAEHTAAELDLIAAFLARATKAGQAAADELAQ